MGILGQFWKLSGGEFPRVVSAEEFLAFDRPDCAKAVLNFHIAMAGDGGARVSTETRVHVSDPSARRRFAFYWRAIYPGSALIRKMWLRAIKRRAERVEMRSVAPHGR